MSGNGGSVLKLRSCAASAALLLCRLGAGARWARNDTWSPALPQYAALIGHGMSSSVRGPCRPGPRRNVDSCYRFFRLPPRSSRLAAAHSRAPHRQGPARHSEALRRPVGRRSRGWARSVAAPRACDISLHGVSLRHCCERAPSASGRAQTRRLPRVVTGPSNNRLPK